MTWAAKARAHFAQTPKETTAKADERGVMAVLAVPSLDESANVAASNQDAATKAKAKDQPPAALKPESVAELGHAAYSHHFTCKHCQAAGRGLNSEHLRCDIGGKLWEAYQNASE